jgi:hypothetical protein
MSSSILDYFLGFLYFSSAGFLTLLLISVLVILMGIIYLVPMIELQKGGDRWMQFLGGSRWAAALGFALFFLCNSVFGFAAVASVRYYLTALQWVGDLLS